jgi:hypothetical protein
MRRRVREKRKQSKRSTLAMQSACIERGVEAVVAVKGTQWDVRGAMYPCWRAMKKRHDVQLSRTTRTFLIDCTPIVVDAVCGHRFTKKSYRTTESDNG